MVKFDIMQTDFQLRHLLKNQFHFNIACLDIYNGKWPFVPIHNKFSTGSNSNEIIENKSINMVTAKKRTNSILIKAISYEILESRIPSTHMHQCEHLDKPYKQFQKHNKFNI